MMCSVMFNCARLRVSDLVADFQALKYHTVTMIDREALLEGHQQQQVHVSIAWPHSMLAYDGTQYKRFLIGHQT